MGKAKEIAELGDKITVSGGTVTVADINTSTFSGTSIHSMQDVDLTGIAHNMFLKYNLSNTQFEVVAGNTSSIDEGTNLYYTDARADARIALANIDAKVASYLSSNDFDTATNIVASITDSAPSTLDTLNELAAALGDDANFSTTVTNSIATKLPLAGGTMTGALNFGDNVKAIFGAGSDLQIYHDGSNSYISDDGDGELLLRTNGTGIRLQKNNGEIMLKALTDGAVQLYYDNQDKLATTATGIDITGTLTSDGLTVDGVSTLNNHVKIANGYSLGWDDITTRITGNSSTDLMQHYTAGVQRMRIAANGDISFYEDTGTTAKFFWDASAESLGIGTSSPASKLHVKKDDSTAFSASSSTWHNIVVSNENTTGGTRTAGIVFELNGYHANAGTGIAAVKNGTAGDYGADLAFITRPQSAVAEERLRITDTGNVGIGNTSPVQKLQVTGNAFIGANGTPVNNSLYASNLDFLQVGKGIIFQAGTDSQGFFKSNHYWNGSGHGFLDTSHGSTTIRFNENNDGILQFETAPSGGVSTTPRLTIRNNGNVGIGTTNPGYKLSVDNGTSDGGIFKIHNEEVGLNVSVNGGVGDYTNSTRMVVFNATRFDSGVSPKLRLGGQGGIEFAADANSVRMVVGSNGNIGIGNTDPTDKLTLTVGNGGGILQSTYYSGTATNGQKLGVIGFKGYSQGNTVAGADAKIEAVAAGNHSGSSAPANLDFYTKGEAIGPGSAAILRHRIHEEGHQTIFKGTNNWSVQRHNQSSGCYVCHRLYGASSSTTTYNLLRYRRHYWGSGSVKFTLSQTYYSGTAEGEYWLTGHGRSDGSYSPSYSISYVDVYNGPGTRLSTNMPGGSPGTSAAEIVDVSISIPAYYYYMVRVEVSHSEYYTTTGVMGSVNSFALFT